MQCKTCAQNIGNEEHQELKNIGNWVAWFLTKQCKVEKGVKKKKQNQCLTKLVRGCLSPHSI
jgi:hypothetical protein